MGRLLGLVLTACVAVPALASSPSFLPAGTTAEKDPQPAVRQRILDGDSRLEKRVTLRLKRSPLATVVAELAGQTGVPMRTSAEVADEPALLSVSDQKAVEVMHQLATLFGFRWTRKGAPGEYAYELYQDLKSKQEEDALRRQRHARALTALHAALRELASLARRPSERLLQEATDLDRQAEARREVSPEGMAVPPAAGRSYRLRELADPCRRALLQVASSLTSDQWHVLMDGEAMHWSTQAELGAIPLPPGPAQALRAARPSALPPGAQAGFVTPEDEASFREEEERSQEAWSRARGYCVIARLTLSTQAAGTEAVLSITPAAVMPEKDPDQPTILPSLIVVGQGAVTPDATEPSETILSWRDDPVLNRKCPLPARASGKDVVGSFDETLALIAERFAINLVADAYRTERRDLSLLPSGDDPSLYELLEQYVKPHAGWSREGAFFRVRRHGWYHLRAREIPEPLVRQWATHLRRGNRLTLEGMAELALSLRDEQLAQFEAVMREAGVLTEIGFDEEGAHAGRQRSVLRAYGSLLPGQRRILDAGGSVSAAAMPPRAQRWLQAALTSGEHTPGTGMPEDGLAGEGLSLAAERDSPMAPATEVRFRYRHRRMGTGNIEEVRVTLPGVEPVTQ